MSFHRIVVAAALIAGVPSLTPELHAQLGGDRIQRPINSPAFSPYLNMFRGRDDGGGLGLNYFGLVRPQLQAQQQNQLLNQNLQSLQRQQAGFQQQFGAPRAGYSQLGITGHPVVFQSFNNASAGGGFGGGGFGGGGFGGGGFGGGGFGGGGFGGGGFGGGGFGGGGLGGNQGQLGGGIPGGAGMNMPGFGVPGFGMSGHPAAFGVFNNTRYGR